MTQYIADEAHFKDVIALSSVPFGSGRLTSRTCMSETGLSWVSLRT